MHASKLPVYEGTRLLEAQLGIVGITLHDPYMPERLWTIASLFAPVPQRMLGGLRAQLVDQRGFVTFINQRDLELLLGQGVSGQMCPWLGSKYVAVGDPNWCGFCVDREDLIDDLQMRELQLRRFSLESGHGQVLAPGQELRRLLHHEQGVDEEELATLLWDNGYSDLEGIVDRWDRTRRRVEWQQAPLLM